MYKFKALLLILFLLIGLPGLAQTETLQPGTAPLGFPFTPNSVSGNFGDTTSQFLQLSATGSVQNNYRLLSLTSPLTGTDNGAKGTYVISVGPVLSYISGLSISTQQTFANTVLGFSGVTAGDMVYFNGTNWVRLPIGTVNQFLQVIAGTPTWTTGGASGAPTTGTYITTTNQTSTLPSSSLLSATAPVVLTNGTNTSTLSLNSTVLITTGAQTVTGQKTFSTPIVSAAQTTGLLLAGSSFTDTVLITDPSAARTLTIPDPGASASFVMSAGTQTLGGTYTITNPLTLSSNTVKSSTGNTITFPNSADTLVNLGSSQTLTSKSLTSPVINTSYILGGARNLTFSWAVPVSAQTYNWPDVAASCDVALNATGTNYGQGYVPYGNGSTYTTLAPGGIGSVFTMGSGNTPNWGANPTPYGTVVAWWATDATIPTGWALCNGQTTTWITGPHSGSSITLPNLIGMFIQGGDITGGSSTANVNGFGSQANQSLQGNNAHTHTYSGTTSTASAQINQGGNANDACPVSHTHTYSGTTSSASSQPACYSMVYIMKLNILALCFAPFFKLFKRREEVYGC